MQPEPTEASQNLLLDTQTQVTPEKSSQHGLRHDHVQASRHLLSGEDGGVPERPQVEEDASSTTSSTSERDERYIGRLNEAGISPKAGSTANRINEYERAHIPSSKKSEGYGFKVVQGGKKGNTGVSIEEFPNEVLTHVLSHLPPPSLSTIALVSRRFHNLVTTPHAWRIAFSRFFPGPDTLALVESGVKVDNENHDFRSDKRSFSRLTALASWRSEYILRTRLLRSLAHGKPAQFQSTGRAGSSRFGGGPNLQAVITYSSQFQYPVSHLHATFGTGLNKKQPLLIHGAAEQGVASNSDPIIGKVGNWGFSDRTLFHHFSDLFPGDAEWGLGPGDMVGTPNVMDVSQLHGMVYGEGCPGGRIFYRSVHEQRGRFVHKGCYRELHLGIPEIYDAFHSVTSVWIAKSTEMLKMTNGVVGILVGLSCGILSSYSLGPDVVHGQRFERGEVTARWVLSPGVPIIAIHADQDYSINRHAQRRIWAVVLNALGEVFYLTEIPTHPEIKPNTEDLEVYKLAWKIGRSVHWNLVDSTRRIARPDPFNPIAVDGSYSPRSSCNAMGLSTEQITAETKEIEKFMAFKPKHFQKVCEGWDMRRKLEVDFAGDDRRGTGEAIVVVNCNLDEGQSASLRRFTRCKVKVENHDFTLEEYPQIPPIRPSLFGRPVSNLRNDSMTPSPWSTPRSRTSSHDSQFDDLQVTESWRISDFTFSGLKPVQISATALDTSTYAELSTSEDPLLGMSGGSTASSPLSSPMPQMSRPSSVSDLPGQRARLIAAGTTTGSIFVWDMRATASKALDIINPVSPLRIIYTDSPQISCLAMTSLYLVHGGNDGLIQAWDPLASTLEPIRTLNSRFSSRARRRLIQAEASVQGVGSNYFAAGAICLDPDPTVLRGIVSLGTHLRYWSYNSSAADQYKSSKRRLRHSERGSNGSPNEQRFTSTGRGALKEYIAHEKLELEREKAARRKEIERMSGRFGVDLLGPGAGEEEMLAYAQMLSEESYTSDEFNRRGSEQSTHSFETIAPHDTSLPLADDSSSSSPVLEKDEDELDADITEAIRQSLDENPDPPRMRGLGESDITIKYVKDRRSPSRSPPIAGSSKNPTIEAEAADLDFALQLSIAEEQSRAETTIDELEEFPALMKKESLQSGDSGKGKGKKNGKGKRRAS